MARPIFYICLAALLHLSTVQLTLSQSLEFLRERPTGEHAEFIQRFRRRINSYKGVGPVEYMKELRESMMKKDGMLTDPNATSIWCLMDNDIIDDKYHPKPLNRKCNMVQKFNFNFESFSSEFKTDMKLSKSVLRVYLQPIRRLLPVGNETVTLQVNVTARAISNNSCEGTTTVSSQMMTITSEMEDHWEEWDITNGLKNCWNYSKNVSRIELTIQFHKLDEYCVRGKKKIPVEIADPAIIPIEEEERRSRHWPLQPFVLTFVDDEEERREIMSSQRHKVAKEDFIIGEEEESEEGISKLMHKRAAVESCKRRYIEINFANLGMHHILAPFQYVAYQCLGDCSKRTISDNNINNHARLLASAKFWYDTKKPNLENVPHDPRCVSLTHSPLSLIVLKKDKNVETRSYPNMSAETCGCRA